MERHCHARIEKQGGLVETWVSVMSRYMHERMIVCFSRRNMLIKKNAQNVTVQDGVV
jgi:hypothetical protein